MSFRNFYAIFAPSNSYFTEKVVRCPYVVLTSLVPKNRASVTRHTSQTSLDGHSVNTDSASLRTGEGKNLHFL